MTGLHRLIANDRQPWVKGLPVLGLIWLVGAVGDRLWFALDHSVPAWDQADYLTGALNYWRELQNPQWFSSFWWTNLWQLSSKIPPLVYLSTTPFLSLFGAGPDQSTLIHLLYSAILLGSVYALGSYLFRPIVGLWAAGLCVLMPGLYHVRLEYLLDYPLAAMVTLTLTCLTVWHGEVQHRVLPASRQTMTAKQAALVPQTVFASDRPDRISLFSAQRCFFNKHCLIFLPHRWLLALAFGLAFGLAMMVKQSALIFLLIPIVWVVGIGIRQRAWIPLVQLAVALCLSGLVMWPWYRTNWLLMLMSGKRATVDSAIAEGDPSLLSLDAWTFYLKQLPGMVSWPLLLAALFGLLCFWRPARVSSNWSSDWAEEPDFAPKPKEYRQQLYHHSRQALTWLLVFWVGAYFLSSLNINKDARYTVPFLPTLAVILAYGLTLLPKRWSTLRWGAVGLSILLMLANLLPLPGGSALQRNTFAYHPAYLGKALPHPEVIAEVVQADPYLRSTIGVLPSTPGINQHNVNYYGMLRNFQVYGRQVGTQVKQVEQDGRSFAWFLTKSGNQGSIRQQEAQTALMQWVEQGTDFRLHKTWALPDGSTLYLHHRRVPLLEANLTNSEPQPSTTEPPTAPSAPSIANPSPVRLDQILLPDRAPPGQPIPVTYKWSGSWELLRSGLLILTWQRLGEPTGQGVERWLHDHGIGMGSLRSSAPAAKPNTQFQVVERSAMLPPADVVAGEYTLEATYFNRKTGETFSIDTPAVSLQIDPTATPSPAPELDWITQLHKLAITLPQGIKALDQVFAEVGRIGQYDPTQDYVHQTRQAMEYRLRQEPQNLDFAYTLALANVLKRRVDPAIAAFQQVVQLDAQNPFAYAYLAFVNLYDWRPQAAETALNTALTLNPNLPELYALRGIAALMQGNLIRAWRNVQTYQAQSQLSRRQPTTASPIPASQVAQ